MARRSSFDSGELTDTAVHVLLALLTPRHGYAVMRFLEAASEETITLGPASLYTTLKKLTAAGLIAELDGTASRRAYHVTSTGSEVLEHNIERRRRRRRRLSAMADRIMEEP